MLQRMQWDGADLHDPSVVLLRMENVGWTPIVEEDYVAPANDPVGIRVAFPGRRVVGMVVTECSHTVLRDFFAPGTPGLGATDGVIRLPKVKLNRRAHYKVLAVLDRVPDFTETDFPIRRSPRASSEGCAAGPSRGPSTTSSRPGRSAGCSPRSSW